MPSDEARGSTICGTIPLVGSIEKSLIAMRANPTNVRYGDLHKVCEHYFGRRGPPVDLTPCSEPPGPVTPG